MEDVSMKYKNGMKKLPKPVGIEGLVGGQRYFTVSTCYLDKERRTLTLSVGKPFTVCGRKYRATDHIHYGRWLIKYKEYLPREYCGSIPFPVTPERMFRFTSESYALLLDMASKDDEETYRHLILRR